jgi:phage host-nuclease inhibitor protein Gam
MTKKQKEKAAALTRDDLEAILRQLCLASVHLDEVEARMNEEIARVRTRFEADLNVYGSTYREHEAMAAAWAEAHPDEFASKKSLAFVHATIGFRLGNPTLKPIAGMTWDKVLDLVRRHAPQYVRVKEELDRAALISAAGELGAENLKTIGLRPHQEERFFVEPHKDSVKELAAS